MNKKKGKYEIVYARIEENFDQPHNTTTFKHVQDTKPKKTSHVNYVKDTTFMQRQDSNLQYFMFWNHL